MAKSRTDYIGPVYPRAESDKFLTPAELGGKVQNFVRTDEGTLRSLAGFLPYQLNRTDLTYYFAAGYGTMHGIFHSVLSDGDDVLLMHMDDGLYVHVGTVNAWKLLVGGSSTPDPLGEGAYYDLSLENDTRARWPTQFVATPSGIIILPGRGRPLYYDGDQAAPLGFVETPGAPYGQGPRNAALATALLPGASGVADDNDNDNPPDGVNVIGYAHDANPAYHWAGIRAYPNATALAANGNDYVTAMFPFFGRCRVGTVAIDNIAMDVSNTGRIEMSQYVATVQWVDAWGNVSAPSARSATVPIYAQSGRENKSKKRDPRDPSEYYEYNPDLLLKQILWAGIDTGPPNAQGRILGRSRDLLNAGTTEIFEVPSGAGSSQQFATIPDTLVTLYPDNVPDAWLIRPIEKVRPMPRARLGALAFGRAFYANSVEEPGKLWWSEPGRWGTIGEHNWRIPDASSREITGVHASDAGLFVFTVTSTFLFRPADDGSDSFVPQTLSSQVGCVAPSSVCTLNNGNVIWLSREGFMIYGRDETKPFIPPMVRPAGESASDVNKARWEQSVAAVDPEFGEYRCWVPTIESDYNDKCYIYDPEQGFRSWRAPMQPASVCVTRDHRRYMLAAGRCNPTLMTAPIADSDGGWEDGVWLIDHAIHGFDAEVVAVLETAWIGAETSFGRLTGRSVKMWLRSTQKSGTLTVEVMRDWREEVVETHTIPLYPTDITDIPEYGETTYTDGEAWLRRRPFWGACDFSTHGAEVFKLRFKVTASPASWEFLGCMFRADMKGNAAMRNAQ